jgi:hypothetical protein
MNFDKYIFKILMVTTSQTTSVMAQVSYQQYVPINVITLGLRETDNINRMITLTE